MSAYYNEIDPYAAQWLRNLIIAGHIADGEVDERSIEDVTPNDLKGFTQHHLFAGLGGWSYALRLAGWPDDEPVWTGSCPCQPFSAAGKGGGFDDERHLWPNWYWLIQQRRPTILFGEQVASGAAKDWVDLVSDDLEGLGYAFGSVAIPACGIGAPHLRQRTWFVANRVGEGLERLQEQSTREEFEALERGIGIDKLANTNSKNKSRGRIQRPGQSDGKGTRTTRQRSEGLCTDGELAKPYGRNASAKRLQRSRKHRQQSEDNRAGELANDNSKRCEEQRVQLFRREQEQKILETSRTSKISRADPLNGYWRDADWLFCRDGKWRAVEPGTFPLADGISNRMGRLRAYGNAIVPQVAAEFIKATM